MGLLERVNARLDRLTQREWVTGPGSVYEFEKSHGHDSSEFSPDEYGNYLATSNEIYSAASLRARLMASLRLGLFNGEGSDKREVKAGPAYEVLRHVNPFWTPQRLARMDELSTCVFGESYWFIAKDNAGVPREIWWSKPSRVKPVPHEDGYIQGYIYEPISGGSPLVFPADEVVWFRYPNPIDEFSPLSPLAAARLAADTASAMMKSNQALFKSGLQIAGVVAPAGDKVAFSKEQSDELERQLDTRFAGADRAHRWAVLRYDAQFRPMSVTPKDAEFSVGLGLTARQVWNAYGIPAPLLNDLEHATLANVRDLMRSLWENTLVPDSDLRAAEVREQFLPMFRNSGVDHCEYDYSKVPALQESNSESWARERQAIDVGALTINEWRASKGLPPVEWGDVFWQAVNKAPVTSGESAPQGEVTPAIDPTTTVPPDPRGLAALNGHVWGA